ncbi:hypothetical protein BKA56DRAFT_486039 [Ilyonectria sp. MPI-CAGE-AT-0026]|nr:hypothetical protein BKA56DRAFT_486039 [Ilyonectria sp. MPI-CAGE-AT-0026]
MKADKTSWHYFPPEVRLLILQVLMQDGCSLAGLATVSREWQRIIERHNFARITLTPSRLADFGSIIHRNRALVGYIWLCLELQEYGCDECASRETEAWCFKETENILIVTAFQDLFSTLTTWEPRGNLLLDISIYSPSDSEHFFKYLTFGPDLPSHKCGRDRSTELSILAKVDDRQHGWNAGLQCVAPDTTAFYKVFQEILGEGPFDDEESENQWWQSLPLIPVVTGVLLRQQNRRRWKPVALSHMFSRLPRLQEIHYEPWREWDHPQRFTDGDYQTLLNSLASGQLRKLVLFEDFNEQYPDRFREYLFLQISSTESIRTPSFNLSRTVANTSLKLEHLSASFMVDAEYFFYAREPSWEWPNLTSLALTSKLLAPKENPENIDNMLQEAAAAAMKMPNLETMEIWNGRKGLAMLFRYQQPMESWQPSVITLRGTWEFAMQAPTIRAWEAVANKHHGCGSVIVKEFLDFGVIQSHGDAIHHLKLSSTVIRPVSLRQIRMEHRIRVGEVDW